MSDVSLRRAVEEALEPAAGFLEEMIRVPSTRGREAAMGPLLRDRFAPLADSAVLVPLPDSLQDDPDYSFRLPGFRYGETANVRVRVDGGRGGRTLALNTHFDVVPPSAGQDDAFEPRRAGGKVFGRGACDAKGQVATVWLALKALRDAGLRPGGDLVADLVAEEECGGNGALRVVRDGLRADAAIVLEPTGLQVANLVRGAVWFTVDAHGTAGHSGSPGTTVSALSEAIQAMRAIEAVREEMLPVSRAAVAAVAGHPNPMPLTFGMLHAGTWPAAAPSEAVLKGVFGFLPPFRREEVRDRIRRAAAPLRAEVRFDMLNSDPSSIPPDHALVRGLAAAAREAGADAAPAFMNASCDAWRYSAQLGIPAVVFGGGTIAAAHSKDEHIALDDIRTGALALLHFIRDWSGTHAR